MPKKRANGEGSYWFDEAKQLHRAAITTPGGNRISKSHKNESVVKDWLNEQRLLIGRGQHVEPLSLTLLDWLYQWLNLYCRPPKIRQRTYERYLSLIPHVEVIGHIPVQKLSPTHLQELYNFLEDEGFSGSTVRQVHLRINASLEQAMINRYIFSNPADMVKAPRASENEVETFTAQDIGLLLQTAKTWTGLYAALLLAITSGMRLGEVLGIRWCDIDATAFVVRVRQNLQYSQEKGFVFEPPKTERGKRNISVPLDTISALLELWHDDLKDDDLVFMTKKLTPIAPSNFLRRFWRRVQIDAEFLLNKTVVNPLSEHKSLDVLLEEHRKKDGWRQFPAKNFHVLRHTYATTLLASGVPIVDVSRALGHAKVSTTLNIYGHAIPENAKIIAEKVAAAFLK